MPNDIPKGDVVAIVTFNVAGMCGDQPVELVFWEEEIGKRYFLSVADLSLPVKRRVLHKYGHVDGIDGVPILEIISKVLNESISLDHGVSVNTYHHKLMREAHETNRAARLAQSLPDAHPAS